MSRRPGPGEVEDKATFALDRRPQSEALDLPGPVAVVPSWRGTTAPYLFSACEAHSVEGIVLKPRNTVYRPGERCDDWRKLKTRHWFDRHAKDRRPR